MRESPEPVAASLCALALLACAGSASPQAQHAPARPAFDRRFEEMPHGGFVPAPGTATTSGDSVVLRSADASESARRTALAMVEALLDSDAAALQRLFAERVVYGMEGVGRPRAELVERCIEETRALAYEPSLRPEHVVDVHAIEVQRADRFHTQVPLPPGVRPGDLLVTLPPLVSGTEARPRVPCVTAVYIRPGEDNAIVALTR